MTKESIAGARTLLNSKDYGILSTISQKFEGFPFGSVVPYSLDDEGKPVILISTIAEHTKNIKSDDRCSITITAESNDVQANGRLCIVGNMKPLSDDKTEVEERYYRYFPNSKSYHQSHDFSFYYLEPVSVRYIGGFGAIHWLEPSDFLVRNPFHGDDEVAIVDHMNKDHQKNLVNYCEHFKSMHIKPDDVVRMVGIDAFGFDVSVNDSKIRFDLETPISNGVEARKALVDMAKATL